MHGTEFIKAIKALDFKHYASVSSREKLVVFTISFLSEHEIPLTFNNICIATFKLFPEKFYFSEEFKEYPHIEMLNRTILHLRPKERNYATGSVGTNYKLTPIGEEVARQVVNEINTPTHKPVAPKKAMDDHKKSAFNDLNKLRRSKLYQKWQSEHQIEAMDAWDYFEVTPYTQINKIKSVVKDTLPYAESQNETDLVELLKAIEKAVL